MNTISYHILAACCNRASEARTRDLGQNQGIKIAVESADSTRFCDAESDLKIRSQLDFEFRDRLLAHCKPQFPFVMALVGWVMTCNVQAQVNVPIHPSHGPIVVMNPWSPPVPWYPTSFYPPMLTDGPTSSSSLSASSRQPTTSNYVLIERYYLQLDEKGAVVRPMDSSLMDSKLPATVYGHTPTRIIREYHLFSPTKPVPNRSGDAKLDGKPGADSKSIDSKATDSKSGDSKPTDSKSGGAKLTDAKPADDSKPELKPGSTEIKKDSSALASRPGTNLTYGANGANSSNGLAGPRLEIPLPGSTQPRKINKPDLNDDASKPRELNSDAQKSDEAAKKDRGSGSASTQKADQSPSSEVRQYPPNDRPSALARALRVVGVIGAGELKGKGPELLFESAHGKRQTLTVDSSNQFWIDLEPGVWTIYLQVSQTDRKLLQTTTIELGENQVIRLD